MLLNIGVLKEMAAITDEVTISGGVFQSKAIAQLTADILGVTCYLSPANEPILVFMIFILVIVWQQETTCRPLRRIKNERSLRVAR